MATVIIDQFNPGNGYWNKLYEVDSADYDPDAPITVDKYGGPYRVRFVGMPDPVEDEQKGKVEIKIVEEEEEEDPSEFDDRGW